MKVFDFEPDLKSEIAKQLGEMLVFLDLDILISV